MQQYSLDFLLQETAEFKNAVRTSRELSPNEKTALLRKLTDISTILTNAAVKADNKWAKRNSRTDYDSDFLNSLMRSMDSIDDSGNCGKVDGCGSDSDFSSGGCGSSEMSGCGSSSSYGGSSCGSSGSGSHC